MNWDWSSFLIGVASAVVVFIIFCVVYEKTSEPDFIQVDYGKSDDSIYKSVYEHKYRELLNEYKEKERKYVDQIKSLTREHGYRVTIDRKNGQYSTYSFMWDDEQLKQHKDNINKLIVGERRHIYLHDKDKEIFILDDDVANIVVAREDGVTCV